MDQTATRSALSFVLPSIVAAAFASIAVGVTEGVQNGFELIGTLGAAGFSFIPLFPLSLVTSLVSRLLWRLWRPARIAAELAEDHGGLPRVAAWMTYAVLATWVLSAASFNAVLLLMARTASKPIVALSAAFAIVATTGLLITASRPAALALTRMYRAIDRVAHRRLERSVLTPRIVIVAAGVVVVMWMFGAWFVSVRPRIGHLDMSFLYYLGLLAVAIVSVHAVWNRVGRRRSAIAGLTLCAVLASAGVGGAALYIRYQQPYLLLTIWGDATLSGGTIDFFYDIHLLRREFRLDEFRPTERPGASHPNVVLITIDTVRASRTPAHAGPAPMPTLAKLAEDGIVFERAYSPGNVTRRSLPSIAMGLSPHRLRGRVAGWALRLDPRHILVAERFRAAGYDTAGFFCPRSQFWPGHKLGLIRGIDHLEAKWDAQGALQTDAAVAWLKQRFSQDQQRPMFTWIHYIEPHMWGQLEKYGKGRSEERYDNALAEVDGFLGRLMEILRSEERRRDTIIVITADHGESLGDRGHLTHSKSLYDAEIHVPLIIVGPGLEPMRIKTPVGLVDVAPTLLDLAGFQPPGMPGMDGISLLPTIRGDDVGDGEAYSAMVRDRSVAFNAYSLISGRYKYMTADNRENDELYDLLSDPKERKNLATTRPDILKRLKERLAARQTIDHVPAF